MSIHRNKDVLKQVVRVLEQVVLVMSMMMLVVAVGDPNVFMQMIAAKLFWLSCAAVLILAAGVILAGNFLGQYGRRSC